MVNVRCFIDGCDGIVTVKHTKATKAKGIVKLYAVCDKCGNHPMAGPNGQRILRDVLAKKKGDDDAYFEDKTEKNPIEKLSNAKADAANVEDLAQENNKDKTDVYNNKNSFFVVPLLLVSSFGLFLILKKYKNQGLGLGANGDF